MLHRQGRQRQTGWSTLAGPLLAAVAIVIALGGAAYATDLLPARSVGTAQLKNGAVGPKKIRTGAVGNRHLRESSVTPDNLGFPLGSAGAMVDQPRRIVSTGHCGPWEGPGEPPPCPPDGNVHLVSRAIELDRPGFVDVAATVNLSTIGFGGHTDGTASVRLVLGVDGEFIAPVFELKLGFGQTEAIPLQGFVELGPGRHEIVVIAGGSGYDYLDLDATSSVLTATVTPKL